MRPTRLSNAPGMAQAYHVLGILTQHEGEVAAAIDHPERSAQLAEAAGPLCVQISALYNLAPLS